MMKKLFVVAGMAVLLAACGQNNDSNSGSTVNYTPPPPGKDIFVSNCAMCHNPVKDATGPMLKGVVGRWGGDKSKLKAFIRNSAAVVAADPNGYAGQLYEHWHDMAMPAFSSLSDAQLDQLIDYVNGD